MVSKAVESLPENGIPQPVSSKDAVSYRNKAAYRKENLPKSGR
jgi:hypothetical protein